MVFWVSPRRPSDRRVRPQMDLTPLHKAAEVGHADVIRTLISAGADVNAKEKVASSAPWPPAPSWSSCDAAAGPQHSRSRGTIALRTCAWRCIYFAVTAVALRLQFRLQVQLRCSFSCVGATVALRLNCVVAPSW